MWLCLSDVTAGLRDTPWWPAPPLQVALHPAALLTAGLRDMLWWPAPPLQFSLHPAALSGCCFSSCYSDLQKSSHLIDNKTLPGVTSPDNLKKKFLDFCWKLLLHYVDNFSFLKQAKSPEPFVVIGKNALGGREGGWEGNSSSQKVTPALSKLVVGICQAVTIFTSNSQPLFLC